MSICRKKRQGDQWYCSKCGLVWDINDANPPKCGSKPTRAERLQVGQQAIEEIKTRLKQ